MMLKSPGHICRLLPGMLFLLTILVSGLFLVCGCGGGGGGNGGSIQGVAGGGTIVVKVAAPDELRLSLAPAGRMVPRAMVWLDTQPENVFLTSESGEYTFTGVPTGIAHRVVCRYDVAATGELFLSRSAEIVLAETAAIRETGELTLEKGLYSISGILRNQFNAAVSDARLSIWGIPFKSGIDGRFTTPALPASAGEEKISIEAAGYRSMQIAMPFLHSQNTMSDVEITLSDSSEPNFAPVVFFSAAPQLVAPGERVQLKISVVDPDEFNPDQFKPVWNNPPGFLETTTDKYSIWWTAPDSPGLATISVSLADSRGAAGAAGIGIAVGGERGPVVRVDRVEPASAAVGQQVVISGSGFGNSIGSVKVSFNGLAAVVKSCSDNAIITEVPSGASTGLLLISCSGSEKSAGIFAILDAGMAIDPKYGPAGTVVKLTGKDFGADPTQGSVLVNGSPAAIAAWTDSQIDFTVPEGATAGVVTLNLRGREKTAGFFKVTRVFNISALKATAGSLLTITGEGWGTSQSGSLLTFAPDKVATVNSWSDTRLVLTVPAGARSGSLIATVCGKSFTLAEMYINAVTQVTPDRGIAGDEMTITGTGFGTVAGTGYVAIGDSRPEILSWNADTIKIRIPAGTRPGNLIVRAGDIDSNGIPVVITAITSISHTRRPTGASLRIDGYGFGSDTGFVLFGETVAKDFSTWKDDVIETVIPDDATGTVALAVSTMGVRSASVPFSVTWIDELDQTEGWPGRELVISGNNLGDGTGNDQVTVNGTIAPVIIWNDREIHCRVPAGTTTGPLVLTISGWPVEITDEFTVYNSFEYVQQMPDWSGPRANSRPLLPGVAEDAVGTVYVTDYDNGWVWKLSADGTQGKFGNLSKPWGIAISPVNSRIYVAESGRHCLQAFDTTGNLIETVGTAGTDNGQFSSPRGLAFDKAGRLYIADSGNSRVQVFNTSGTPSFKTTFGSSGSTAGLFVIPSGVAVDSSFNVYVADAGNHRVQRFSPDSGSDPAVWNFSGWVGSKDPNAPTPGWLLAGSGLPSSADGGFYRPYGIGLAGDEKILVADSDNNRVQVIDALTGKFVSQIGAAGTTSGQYNQPLGVFYRNDRVVIADSSNARVQKSTLAGEYVSEVLPDTSRLNTRPGRVAVDSAHRRVYILDIDDGSITVLGLEGQVLQVIGSRGSGKEQFYKPEGLALDRDGNVFVADTGNARVHIIDPTGIFIKTWGVYGTGPAQFISPKALAVSADGAFVFVTDAKQNRIQKFTRDGVFVKTWGSSGAGDDGFALPSGIAADQKGNLYIADQNNHRIKKYSVDGTFVGWWGSYDAGAQSFWLDPGSMRSGAPSDSDGGFDTPTDVAVDSQGKVYVTDSGNFRMQVFAADQASTPAGGWQGEIYTGENLRSLAIDDWATVYTIPLSGVLRRYVPDL